MKTAIDESRTARVLLALSKNRAVQDIHQLSLWLQSWSSVFLTEVRNLKISEDKFLSGKCKSAPPQNVRLSSTWGLPTEFKESKRKN